MTSAAVRRWRCSGATTWREIRKDIKGPGQMLLNRVEVFLEIRDGVLGKLCRYKVGRLSRIDFAAHLGNLHGLGLLVVAILDLNGILRLGQPVGSEVSGILLRERLRAQVTQILQQR